MSDPNVIHVNTQKPPSIVNAIVSSLSKRFNDSMFGVSKGGARDLNKVYGYNEEPEFQSLYSMWRRFGLATRIVNSIARSSWRDSITVLDGTGETALSDEIDILNRHGKLTKRLEQADILNRIGRYSVLFVGIPDGLKLSQPIGKVSGDRLSEVYFRAYAEDGIQVRSYVTDQFDPRFGQPETYQLQTMNRGSEELDLVTQSIIVHHSRIVHFAEGALENDIDGVSALEPILNTLEDIVKTAGGSAEAYFRNARNKFAMETDPKFATEFSPEEKLKLEEEAQRFQNEWQDFIRAGGINIKPLNVPHHSPLDTFKALTQILAGSTGIPIRVLLGEGSGQLAGNEDKESYNQLIQDRRDLNCTEWFDSVMLILSHAGMIDYSDDLNVTWDTPDIVSSKEKAVTAKDKATALAQMASAISQPALDGAVDVEDVIKLVFGEKAAAEIEIDNDVDRDRDIEV